MANKLDIKTNMPTDAELDRMFDAVDKLERYAVGDAVIKAGVEPIVKRARELAPRSSKTGTAKKRSRTQINAANWNIPLWKTIKRVVRKYQKGTIGVVGPEWPAGNKAYFNTSPKGRRQVLWGKVTGKVVAQIRNWIVQAFDETKPEQLEAMKAKLKEKIDQMMKAK
jgi:hypothetical protein